MKYEDFETVKGLITIHERYTIAKKELTVLLERTRKEVDSGAVL